MNNSQTLEIVGGNSFNQINKLIDAAVNTGANVIHLRHCILSSEEVETLKNKYELAQIIFEEDNSSEVFTLLKEIKKGDMLTLDMLEVKKGTNGVTVDLLNNVLGKKVLYDLKIGTTLTFGLIDL
ncbi:hypothetical protein HZA97_04265 [Candidatus Woesearchaeota archaeon]|nr:hypothetical protein [Candidatus Woesearchaeota archaeon]